MKFTLNNAGKMWCYSRLVYLPMSYLYGKKFVGPITPLILSLREELFIQPYDKNNWKKARQKCAKVKNITKMFLDHSLYKYNFIILCV